LVISKVIIAPAVPSFIAPRILRASGLLSAWTAARMSMKLNTMHAEILCAETFRLICSTVCDALCAMDTTMQRNMDLIRAILLDIEATQVPPGGFLGFSSDGTSPVEGYTAADCLYNLRTAIDGGLVRAGKDHGMMIAVHGLTWKGHDFLDQVRDPEIWRITKEGASKAGGFSLDLLAALAKGFLKNKIEEHTGVALDL
jgi:hypothetical protein